MKVIFELERNQSIFEDLKKIASKYNTPLRKQDEGEGYFIFVKSRIKITEKYQQEKRRIHVWGAKEEDILYLTKFWGEPIKKITQKLTPQAFVEEIIKISDIKNLTKNDIIELLEISERDYNQYKRFIERTGRRPNASDEIKKAFNILKKLS